GIASLAAATDLLDRHVKRERIAAVVRRPATQLGGCSLLEMAGAGRYAEGHAAGESMFDLRRIPPRFLDDLDDDAYVLVAVKLLKGQACADATRQKIRRTRNRRTAITSAQ